MHRRTIRRSPWPWREVTIRRDSTITERNLPSEEAKDASEEGWRIALTGLKESRRPTGGRDPST